LSRELISGREAIIYRRSENSPNPAPLTFIQTHDGAAETIVFVRGLSESFAFDILAGLE
jgi:hypothetical protein